ncbi:medium-chain acyl-CoA ligase ACSF2, mitochondrial [Harmonia axyridis]|uniref:medium-chain acyl-CoA ligase ACSF2, mitochondrial n=1 Tax=Harmonia axyridis TaxID=115357 RepID=UPI001E278E82|nr:medium-chain acyl-CoA ligase ACSF2, mitochondrial [Harmonia axyridis]XP_045473089.1 medium-chain acyl-CoA ligase ACSF2, mitochondrial [Harmonia axyridis]
MFGPKIVRVLGTSARCYSYLHQVGPEPLQYITIGQLLEKSAKSYGDRDFIKSLHQNKKFTYAEALEECDRFAAGLLKIGLKKGDRVGLWCPSIIEWPTVKFACARAGLILVALNPSYQVPEMEYSINKVGVKCLICPDKVKKMNYYEMLNTLIPELENSEAGQLNSSRVPSLKSLITISEDNFKGSYNYHDITRCSDTSLVNSIKKNQSSISPDAPFSILFSSGTTGKPKAAVVSHFSHVNNAIVIGRRMELDQKQHKICMMVPFFHSFGINISVNSCVTYGSTIVLPTTTYDPAANLTALSNEKCTVIHGTPTMHLDLITEQRKRNEDISPEIAITGGAPVSPHQFTTMLDVLKLKSVKSIYGLTETTCMVFTSNPGDDLEKSTATVGLLGDHTEVKVVDTDGNVVPFGTPGELWVRGYMIMKEYWGEKEKTESTLDKDGWLKTGDQFVIGEDGYGRIVGRLKDMIIRGGENIFPKEIEDVLIKHPDIIEVHVIGLPHERLGEEVGACIRLKDNSEVSSKEIIEFCKGKMAHFKIPKHIKFVEQFPKTESGKVQKFLLVKQYSQ